MKRNNKGQFDFGNEGRSKKWSTPEELQKDIDSYFDWCDNNPLAREEASVKTAVKLTIRRPYTVEGLANWLHTSRETLHNYQHKPNYEPYFDIITRAKQKIVQSHVEYGLAGIYNAPMTKFLMVNNTRYQDKVEQTNDGQLTVKIVRE